MKKIILLLMPLLFSATGCKRQFVEAGWYKLNKDEITKTRGLTWKLTQTREDLYIFFEKELSNIDREDIVDDFEDAYEEVLELLSLDDYDDEINIFLVANGESMAKITGTQQEVRVLPLEHVILMQLPGKSEKIFKKVLAQLIMQNVWGKTADWMLAGYSTYISEHEEKEELHSQAAQFLLEHNITLATLIGDFDKIDEPIGQVLAGSFVLHLIEDHGNEVVKSIWLSNDLITSRKIEEMEKNWKKKLTQD